jgi:hypothetical protein
VRIQWVISSIWDKHIDTCMENREREREEERGVDRPYGLEEME